MRCVTGSETFGNFFFRMLSNYLRGLGVASRGWRTAGHLEAPAEGSFRLGRDGVEALHLEHRFWCELLRHSEGRMHCHAERAVIVRRRGVVVRVLLLEGGELGV